MSYYPTKEDKRKLRRTIEYFEQKLQNIGEVKQAGSTAKGTWVKGDTDIDLYVFTNCIDKALTEVKKLFPEGYVKSGQLTIWNVPFGEFDVDIVIVDKNLDKREDTLLHADFYKLNLDNLQKHEVIKAKAYFKTKGVYGAEIGGIVGIAIEELIRQHQTFTKVAKFLLTHGREIFLQDPTMTKKRNLLASINSRRWRQIKEACKEYLEKPRFQYKPMTAKEFKTKYKGYQQLIFSRYKDKGTDFLTANSIASKASNILRNKEPILSIEYDVFADNREIVICYKVVPEKLNKTKTVCVDTLILKPDEIIAFKEAHPNTYEQDHRICAEVPRVICNPSAYYRQLIKTEMKKRGYRQND